MFIFYNHLGGRKELDIVEGGELQWMDFNGRGYMGERYNILIKVMDEGEIIIIRNLNYIIENNEDPYLKTLIETGGRSLEELERDIELRKEYGMEYDGKYKILSGSMEEIIGEIREIFLLGEII